MKRRSRFAAFVLGCVVQFVIVPGGRASAPTTKPGSPSTTDESTDEVLKAHADPHTPRGAVLELAQGFLRQDAEAMSRVYFADGDPDQKLAKANAERILCCVHFADAVPAGWQFNGEDLTKLAGLLSDRDVVWWSDQITESGDTASVQMPGSIAAVPLRRIGQNWRVDITPKPPETAGHLAATMMENNDKLKQITSNLQAKDTTISSVAGLDDVFVGAGFSSVAGALAGDR